MAKDPKDTGVEMLETGDELAKTLALIKQREGLNIHHRIAAIIARIGKVEKSGKNIDQNYAYIQYDDVTVKLARLMEQFGITVTQNNIGEPKHDPYKTYKGAAGRHYLVEYTFTVTNVDKPEDKLEFKWFGESMDTGDKGYNKSATGAEKYFLLKLFKVSSKDDPDANTPPDVAPPDAPVKQAQPTDPMQPKQRAKINMLLSALGNPDEVKMQYLTDVYGTPADYTIARATEVISDLTKEYEVMQANEGADGQNNPHL